MISIEKLCDCLVKGGIDFFTGVPDTYLNDFCNYILHNHYSNNIIAANEGNAIAVAAGHYFATRQIPLVYMQNSGLGNAINPLVSLVDSNVYSVPMILLIGWRGESGTGDWCQHTRQGAITTKLLDDLEIEYSVLRDEQEYAELIIKKAIDSVKSKKNPYAIVVPKGVLMGKKKNIREDRYTLSRREAIEIILDTFPKDTIYLATTGRTTRELFYIRERRNESHEHDFLNIGAMGHTSSVALGMALAKPDRQFVVLDGDGACIMHMGAMTTVSKYHVPNYLHIVLNNGVHESVGGQPTAGYTVNFTDIAIACGYDNVDRYVTEKDEIIAACNKLFLREKAGFLEIRVNKGMTEKLPPLKFSIKENICQIMRGL